MLQTPTKDTGIQESGIAAGSWLIDPNSGRIAFAVKTFWGLVDVKGTFDRFEGALSDTNGAATGVFVVHTDSLDTKNKKRDEHLRSADFFDSESHPRVTFSTTAVTDGPAGTIVSGDLVVGGTRTHLDVITQVEQVDDETLSLSASLAIPREDVGLVWNKAGMIKGDVRLDLELRLVASS